MKQVIVIRKDLGLGKGKLAAHIAHASLAGYKLVKKKNPNVIKKWEAEGEKKIVVKIESEKALLELYEKVKKTLPAALIRDAGLTQIPAGTITCIAIGPWGDAEIDAFTKDLKLL